MFFKRLTINFLHCEAEFRCCFWPCGRLAGAAAPVRVTVEGRFLIVGSLQAASHDGCRRRTDSVLADLAPPPPRPGIGRRHGDSALRALSAARLEHVRCISYYERARSAKRVSTDIH